MQFLFRLGTAVLALLLTLAILIAGIAAAGYYYLEPGLPGADTMREVKLQTPLRIYSRDGRLMAQLGEQWRTPVRFEDVPDVVVKAFLAAEDDRFFEHPGFDYQGILRAGINYALTGARTQGGSTITQQLARAYFLTPERSFVRKARELILAVRIEKEFTKPEILSLYLNKIFLGQRAYGIAAAAEVYFDKDLPELTLAEAATLAGIPKAPSQLNPVNGPDRATQRRRYVLGRMRSLGFIDSAQYEEAIATPLVSRLHGPKVELDAPYVTEMVRAEMVERFGPAAYTDGYQVVTTVDSRLQAAANTALATALFEYDRRHGYRGPSARDVLARIPAEPGPARDQALQALLDRHPGDADFRPAVVLSLAPDNSARLFVRGVGELTVPWDGLRWRRYLTDAAPGMSCTCCIPPTAAGCWRSRRPWKGPSSRWIRPMGLPLPCPAASTSMKASTTAPCRPGASLVHRSSPSSTRPAWSMASRPPASSTTRPWCSATASSRMSGGRRTIHANSTVRRGCARPWSSPSTSARCAS